MDDESKGWPSDFNEGKDSDGRDEPVLVKVPVVQDVGYCSESKAMEE